MCAPCSSVVLHQAVEQMLRCNLKFCPHRVACFVAARELQGRLQKEIADLAKAEVTQRV